MLEAREVREILNSNNVDLSAVTKLNDKTDIKEFFKKKNGKIKIAFISSESGKEHLLQYIIGKENILIKSFPASRDSVSEILKFYPDILIADTDTVNDALLKNLIFNFHLSYDYIPIILAGRNKQRLFHFWQYGVFDIIDLNLQDKKADNIIDNAVRLKNILSVNFEENMLDYLARIADAKSIEDVGHSKRVSVYSLSLARAHGIHDEKFLKHLYLGARYHDIGKIAIPETITRKRGSLYKNEYEIVKRHTIIGYYIVTHYGLLPEEVGEIVKYHHEWFNGTGYPDGLKGDEIPLGARIVAIADAFDAITTTRPYREKKTLNYAINELLKFKGTQFDPDLVDSFIRLIALS